VLEAVSEVAVVLVAEAEVLEEEDEEEESPSAGGVCAATIAIKKTSKKWNGFISVLNRKSLCLLFCQCLWLCTSIQK